jgi:hypothetical protein
MGSATVFFVYVTETHSLATRAMGTGLCMALMLVMQVGRARVPDIKASL